MVARDNLRRQRSLRDQELPLRARPTFDFEIISLLAKASKIPIAPWVRSWRIGPKTFTSGPERGRIGRPTPSPSMSQRAAPRRTMKKAQQPSADARAVGAGAARL